MDGIPLLEPDERRRARVVDVGDGHEGDQRHFAEQTLQPRRPAVGSVEQKGPLAVGRYRRIVQVPGHEHQELVLVIDHVIVLASPLQAPQHLGGLLQRPARRIGPLRPPLPEIPRHQRVVDLPVLPDRLTSKRLLVADRARASELPQHAGEHVLRHGRHPDRLHHERGHQHVAAEIGREVGQARHQLLAGAEQLHPADLALEPPGPNPPGAVGGPARLGQKGEELAVEDLGSAERRERRGVGGQPDRQVHQIARARTDRDGPGPGPQDRIARGGPELERQAVAAVERRPCHRDPPPVPITDDRNGRKEPASQRVEGSGLQEREMIAPHLRRKPGHRRHQQRLLRHLERRRRERLQLPPGIDEIPLHPHGAQQEPAELDLRRSES